MGQSEQVQEPSRRKADQDRKTTQIRIRISAVEKERFTEVAQRFGLDLSAWLRMLGASAVRTERLRTREACREEANKDRGNR